MKFKYKSIQNIIRLQEKIEELNNNIENYYQLTFEVDNDKYFLESFFYLSILLGLSLDAGFFMCSLITFPFYLHYIKNKEYSFFNKIKLTINSKDKRISEDYSNIELFFVQKYGFINPVMKLYINEFKETLNSFERNNIKHFLKVENNKVKINTINKVFYQVAEEYISKTPTELLIENKNEVFSFIDKVELESLQDELILKFNNKTRNYINDNNDKEINYIKLRFEESKLNQDLIKSKKRKNKIIKNI